MSLIVVTPATTEPVTLVEAKAHLRMIHSADDALISLYITAAREAVENNTGMPLADAEYNWVSDGSVICLNRLPLAPVAAVASVSYADATGARVTIDPADYQVDLERGTVEFGPAYNATRIGVEFSVEAVNVPAALKASILLLVADMYEQASANVVGSVVSISPTVDRLLYPYRRNLGV